MDQKSIEGPQNERGSMRHLKKIMQAKSGAATKYLCNTFTALLIASLIFDVVYFYAYLYIPCLSSDAAVFVTLARHLVEIRSPVAFDWYYPNSDIFIFTPHVFGVFFNWLLGFGPNAARWTAISNFLLCYIVITWALRSVSGNMFGSILGAALALAPLTNAHVEFIQLQGGYAWFTSWMIAIFALYVSLMTRRISWPRAVVLGLLVALLFASNPLRGVAYVALPIAAAEFIHALMIRQTPALARLLLFLSAAIIGVSVYYLLVRGGLTFALPSGAQGMKLTAIDFWQALDHLRAFPGLYFKGISGYPLTTFTFLTFSAGLILAFFATAGTKRQALLLLLLAMQFLAVAAAGVLGNVFADDGWSRYFMPPMIGLFAVVGLTLFNIRERTFAAILFILFTIPPVVADLSVTKLWNIERESGWPVTPSPLQPVASFVREAGITRVYSQWTANAYDVIGTGAYQACFLTFRQSIMPFKWNSPHDCYDPAHLPDRFAIIVKDPRRDLAASNDTTAVSAAIDTLGAQPVLDKTIGRDRVLVFKTSDVDSNWLRYPVADGSRIKLPLEDSVINPQMFYRELIRKPKSGQIIFEGKTGEILYGPYVTLPAGRYQIEIFGSIISAKADDFSFFVNAGKAIRRVAEGQLLSTAAGTQEHMIAVLSFRLTSSEPIVHFVVEQRGTGKMVLTKYRIDRMNDK
jgi:hypothetical protein